MTDNFTELKRLFDGVCEEIEQVFFSTKWRLDFLDEQERKERTTSLAIAKLLDGHSIMDATAILKRAIGVIKQAHKVHTPSVEEFIRSLGD